MKKLLSVVLSLLIIVTAVTTSVVITGAEESVSTDLNDVSSWAEGGALTNTYVFGDSSGYTDDFSTIATSTELSPYDNDGKSLHIYGSNGTPFVADLTVEANTYYTINFWVKADNLYGGSAVNVWVLKSNQKFDPASNGIAVSRHDTNAVYSKTSGGIEASDKVLMSVNPSKIAEKENTWYEYKMTFNTYENTQLGLVLSPTCGWPYPNLYIDEITVEKAIHGDLESAEAWANVGYVTSTSTQVYGDSTSYQPDTSDATVSTTSDDGYSYQSGGSALKFYTGAYTFGVSNRDYHFVTDLSVKANTRYKISFWVKADCVYNGIVNVAVVKKGSGMYIRGGATGIAAAYYGNGYYSRSGGGAAASDKVSMGVAPAQFGLSTSDIVINTWYKFEMSFDSYDNTQLGLVISGSYGDAGKNIYIDEFTVEETISLDLDGIGAWTIAGKDGDSKTYGDVSSYSTDYSYMTLSQNTSSTYLSSEDSNNRSIKTVITRAHFLVADLTVKANTNYKLSFWYQANDCYDNAAVLVDILTVGSAFSIGNGVASSTNSGAATTGGYYSMSGGGSSATDAVVMTTNPSFVTDIAANTWYKFEMTFNSYNNTQLGLAITSSSGNKATMYLDEITVTEEFSGDLNLYETWQDVGIYSSTTSQAYGDTSTYLYDNAPTIASVSETTREGNSDGKAIRFYNGGTYKSSMVTDLNVKKFTTYEVSFWYMAAPTAYSTTENCIYSSSALRIAVLKQGNAFDPGANGIAAAYSSSAAYSKSGLGYNGSDKVAMATKPCYVEGISANVWYQFKMTFNSYGNETLGFAISSAAGNQAYIYLDDIQIVEKTLEESVTENFEFIGTAIRKANESETQPEQALRFKNTVEKSIIENGIAYLSDSYTLEQYGFVVIKASSLGDEELTLDNAKYKPYAYDRASGKSIIFSQTNDLIYYTAALKGFKVFTNDYTVRSYVTLSNNKTGETVTYYIDNDTVSIYEVAAAAFTATPETAGKEAAYTDSENNKWCETYETRLYLYENILTQSDFDAPKPAATVSE